MNPLTPERLAEIEKRCNAATAGPWRTAMSYKKEHYGPLVAAVAPGHHIQAENCSGGTYPNTDMDFIAHARTDIPDLLNEIKRLREEEEVEHGRWQNAIYNLVTKETGQLHPPPMIDGKGCDSGDPLDFTLSEIQQAIGAWEDHAANLRAQLSDVTAQYKHCHSLYSERIGLTDRLGRLVESLQAQLSDAQAERDKFRAQWLESNRRLETAHEAKLTAEAQLSDAQAALKVSQDAMRGMLGNYIELKRISLYMAKSDSPNWIGRDMQPEDDIHVQAVTAALQPGRE
jgi:hypothetical protein